MIKFQQAERDFVRLFGIILDVERVMGMLLPVLQGGWDVEREYLVFGTTESKRDTLGCRILHFCNFGSYAAENRCSRPLVKYCCRPPSTVYGEKKFRHIKCTISKSIIAVAGKHHVAASVWNILKNAGDRRLLCLLVVAAKPS